jgi:hypothetical protein
VVRIFAIFNAVGNKLYHKKWLAQSTQTHLVCQRVFPFRVHMLTRFSLAASETLFIFSQLFGDAFVPHTTPSWQYILDHLSPTPNATVICKICESLLQVRSRVHSALTPVNLDV